MNLRGLVLGFGALCLLVPAVEATAAVSMGDLQRQAQQMREREAKICRAVVRRAAARIKRNIRAFEENDDELLKSIAQDTYEQLHYPFDLVLDP